MAAAVNEFGFAGNCFRCGNGGHYADSPLCPWLIKATTKTEHEKRIDNLRDRYWEQRITEWQKRDYIKHENRLWYDGHVPSRIT
jgi:hypothetical protein